MTEKKDGRRGSLFCTGLMGETMKESTSIAYSVAKSHLALLEPNNDFFDRTRIHLHAVDGATPKDGPSAGVALVTSLLSLALNRPIKSDLAMTGELSLTGRVMVVGGLQEKILGAKRANVHEVILPMDLLGQFQDLPFPVREGVTTHFVDHYYDIIRLAFGDHVNLSLHPTTIKTILPPESLAISAPQVVPAITANVPPQPPAQIPTPTPAPPSFSSFSTRSPT